MRLKSSGATVLPEREVKSPVGERLDDELVQEFAARFCGYGSWSARVWYIGIEEGLGRTSFSKLSLRFSKWAKRGKHELEDLIDYHRDIEVPDWQRKVQPTWRLLMRIQLHAERTHFANKPRELQEQILLDYQNQSLGRRRGDNTLIELLPLPSRNTARKEWLYSKHSGLPQLSSRQVYQCHYFPLRAEAIRKKVARYKPRVVIFHGSSKEYRPSWNHISGGTFSGDCTHPLSFLSASGQLFVLIRKRWRGSPPDTYYDKVGKIVQAHLASERGEG